VERPPVTGDRDGAFLTGHLERLANAAEVAATRLAPAVQRYAEWVWETLDGDGRLLLCGNGGSAATVEHVAAEYAVRFRRVRAPLSAIALSANTAALTAAANDYGFDQVFARAVCAHGRPGDLLVLHSTSGRSTNLVLAAREAASLPARTVALLGPDGGDLAAEVDLAIRIPAADAAQAQELQLAIEHAVVDRVDAWLAGEAPAMNTRDASGDG